MDFSIALPKGRLLPSTAELLTNAGLNFDDYSEKARLYRLKCTNYPSVRAKIFQEKDIPIQVAIGNYDLGICGLDWVEEQLVKFPGVELVKIKSLGYGDGSIFAAVSSEMLKHKILASTHETVRLASEYPNLAEALAQHLRLKRFSIFPLWGAADIYPPGLADIVLLSRKSEEYLTSVGLVSLGKVVDFKAVLVANRRSLMNHDLSAIIDMICSQAPGDEPVSLVNSIDKINAIEVDGTGTVQSRDDVNLALPDGHQQVHVRKMLDAAAIPVEDYPSTSGARNPSSGLEGFNIKVLRPQDMPAQVANGNFDLAITGRDWLTDHLYQFPSSPVEETMDLKYGWVRIVAVVDNTLPVDDRQGLTRYCRNNPTEFRVASEYVNISDAYARQNHLGSYKIIPTWGATEAFLPEDADLLIENTETGSTIARHNLKIIDTLFESTACIISRKDPYLSPLKVERINAFLDKMKSGLAEMV